MKQPIEGADYSKARTDLDFIRLLKTTPSADKESRQKLIEEWQKKYEEDVRKAEEDAINKRPLFTKWAVTETTV